MDQQQAVSTQVISSSSKEKKNSRRIGKRGWSAIIAVALVATLGVSAVITNGFGLLGGSAQAEISSYQVLDLTIGDLSTSVTGTGTLSLSETASVTIPAGVKIASIEVQAGESINAGDALVTLDTGSVQDKIDSLQDELETVNTTLASYSGDTADSKIKATVEGRVMQVYGEAGDSVADVMAQYGALAVLSVDGTMSVRFTPDRQDVTVGQTVSVILSNKSAVEGTVDRIDGSTAVVRFSDKKASVGEVVTVRDAYNNLLGSGAAEISHALRITGTVGTIASVSVSEHSAVYKNSTLFTLENLPLSKEYLAALAQREELLADLAQMEAYRAKPVIVSSIGGLVDTIGVSKGETLAADATIDLSTRQRVVVTVNIDELDILNVSAGMTASVTFGAIDGEAFTGTVAFISAKGTTTNNVTTYPVQIELNDDARLMPGMSSTASIVVSESRGALLVPVSAISTTRGESYVYVYTGTLPTDGVSEPGVKTQVTTGLSNDKYAEVTSGLTLGQQVVTAKATGTQIADASAGAQQEQGNMMGGMMMGGGTPPSGMSGGRPN